VTHYATPRFWRCYRKLPDEIQDLADSKYALLKTDPAHVSLHFKKTASLWSVRVGLHYRALATEVGGDFVWFWMGSHAEYDKLVGRKPRKKSLQAANRRRKTAKTRSRARRS
jgi:hypothetical protein